MFGTIVINAEALSKEENSRYGAWYCGLCGLLDRQYGSIGSASLTYDMTFVAMLLSSVHRLSEEAGSRRCVPHPLKPHPTLVTEATAYAADMNMVLAYYQCLDDWNDDNNRAAYERAKQIEKHLGAARENYPRQCAAIAGNLQRLGRMEKANELNPDLPANCFGDLIGELFNWRESEYSGALRRMGAALGRFVYLLDAVNDLIADIKKQRYNPLMAQMDTDFVPMLTLMMAECTAEFEKLPVQRDRRILENVLYSGVWQKYRVRKKGAEAEDG